MLWNIIHVFGTKIGVVLVTLLISILLARGLGISDRGHLASLLIFSQLMLPFFEGGMRQSATFFIGREHPRDEVLNSLCFFGLVSSVAAFLCSVAFVYLNYNDQGMFANFIVALILVSEIVLSLVRGVLLGGENFKFFNRVLIVPKVITLLSLFAYYLFFGQLSISFVLLVMVLSNFACLIILYFYGSRPKLGLGLAYLAPMLRKGLIYGVAFFVIVANYKIDSYMLSLMSQPEELGVYAVSVQFGEVLWQLPAAVVTVLLSRVANKNKHSDVINDVIRTMSLTFWCTFLAALLLFVTAEPLVKFLFGQEFIRAVDVITVLIPGLVFMIFFKIINSYYAGNGQPYVSLFFMVPALVVNVAANFYFIPIYGAFGAGLSSSISYIFASILIAAYFAKKMKVSVISFFFRWDK